MNSNELRKILTDEIYKLRAGKAKPQRVNAVCNAAGKIIASVRLDLDYGRMTGATPDISFMGGKALPKPSRRRPALSGR